MTRPTADADALTPAFQTRLLAILRGLAPERADEVGTTLTEAGVVALEVPLNRDGALESIARLAHARGPGVTIGAGTVLDEKQPRAVADAGGTFVVMPHGNPSVIRASRDAGLACAAGVATPSEAFAALAAGASALKLFPAQSLPPSVVRAWRAVLPPATRMMVVGGVTVADVAGYFEAGADAIGVGSRLFHPDISLGELRERALGWVAGCAESAVAGERFPPDE